jgi:hypothetical protein
MSSGRSVMLTTHPHI